jgi:hypothetical protein
MFLLQASLLLQGVLCTFQDFEIVLLASTVFMVVIHCGIRRQKQRIVLYNSIYLFKNISLSILVTVLEADVMRRRYEEGSQ